MSKLNKNREEVMERWTELIYSCMSTPNDAYVTVKGSSKT